MQSAVLHQVRSLPFGASVDKTPNAALRQVLTMEHMSELVELAWDWYVTLWTERNRRWWIPNCLAAFQMYQRELINYRHDFCFDEKNWPLFAITGRKGLPEKWYRNGVFFSGRDVFLCVCVC